jgi:hypothetical protein
MQGYAWNLYMWNVLCRSFSYALLVKDCCLTSKLKELKLILLDLKHVQEDAAEVRLLSSPYHLIVDKVIGMSGSCFIDLLTSSPCSFCRSHSQLMMDGVYQKGKRAGTQSVDSVWFSPNRSDRISSVYSDYKSWSEKWSELWAQSCGFKQGEQRHRKLISRSKIISNCWNLGRRWHFKTFSKTRAVFMKKETHLLMFSPFYSSLGETDLSVCSSKFNTLRLRLTTESPQNQNPDLLICQFSSLRGFAKTIFFYCLLNLPHGWNLLWTMTLVSEAFCSSSTLLWLLVQAWSLCHSLLWFTLDTVFLNQIVSCQFICS